MRQPESRGESWASVTRLHFPLRRCRSRQKRRIRRELRQHLTGSAAVTAGRFCKPFSYRVPVRHRARPQWLTGRAPLNRARRNPNTICLPTTPSLCSQNRLVQTIASERHRHRSRVVACHTRATFGCEPESDDSHDISDDTEQGRRESTPQRREPTNQDLTSGSATTTDLRNTWIYNPSWGPGELEEDC